MAHAKVVLAKIETWKKCLNNLKYAVHEAHKISKTLGKEETENFVCMALIQALEIAIEALWKLARIILLEIYEVDVVAAPKGVFAQAFEKRIITAEEFEMLIAILGRRNEMAHTYNQEHAQDIMGTIERYAEFLETVGAKFAREECNS